jgi:hypothetical protein
MSPRRGGRSMVVGIPLPLRAGTNRVLARFFAYNAPADPDTTPAAGAPPMTTKAPTRPPCRFAAAGFDFTSSGRSRVTTASGALRGYQLPRRVGPHLFASTRGIR